MDKIKVLILNESNKVDLMTGNLARLTQHSESIKTEQDLKDLFAKPVSSEFLEKLAALPHGTIKRFAPVTLAILGASRRFLSQIRTHSVGIEFVSGSIQYSNYTNHGEFVVPYEFLDNNELKSSYLEGCGNSMRLYESMINSGIPQDSAGYLLPQGLRNVLVISANHEAWSNILTKRLCNRNTKETQYVSLLIWEKLLETHYGKELFSVIGPDCLYGKCREDKFCCKKPFTSNNPSEIIKELFPLCRR